MVDMALGKLGSQDLIFKRKFRWTFKVQETCDGKKDIPECYVKVAARPSLTVEETEINFLNSKGWLPGKAAWETITVTYYDVGGKGDEVDSEGIANLWGWLATIYNFSKGTKSEQGANRKNYAGKGVLTLYDGCGKGIEEWTLEDMWPQAINFGELDYSSSEECTIELTLRYSKVQYDNQCGNKIAPCECAGC